MSILRDCSVQIGLLCLLFVLGCRGHAENDMRISVSVTTNDVKVELRQKGNVFYHVRLDELESRNLNEYTASEEIAKKFKDADGVRVSEAMALKFRQRLYDIVLLEARRMSGSPIPPPVHADQVVIVSIDGPGEANDQELITHSKEVADKILDAIGIYLDD